jgi:hypothetical protein
VEYIDETGETRHGVLEMQYYADPQLWHTLRPDATVNLLHLPSRTPGNDRVVLAEYEAEVREYQGYFSLDTVGVLLVCWLIVILNPYFLYVGLVDMDMLFKDKFPS